jgi:hypothetical protein
MSCEFVKPSAIPARKSDLKCGAVDTALLGRVARAGGVHFNADHNRVIKTQHPMANGRSPREALRPRDAVNQLPSPQANNVRTYSRKRKTNETTRQVIS